MANKEQLAILKQGVAVWNKWREENPDAKIDLRWARLNGHNLSGANFRKADIRHASFKEAILVKTDFREIRVGIDLLIKYRKLKHTAGNICKNIKNFHGKLYSMIVIFNKKTIDNRFPDRNTGKLFNIAVNIYFLIIAAPFLFPSLLVQYEHYYSVYNILKFIDGLSEITVIVIFIFLSFILIAINVPSFEEQDNSNEHDIGIILCSCIIFSVFSFYIRGNYKIKQLSFLSDTPEIVIISISFGIFLASILIFDFIIKINSIIKNRFITNKSKIIYFCADFTSANLTNSKFYKANLDYIIFDNAILTGCSFANSYGLLNVSGCNGTILADHDVCKLLVFGTGNGLFLKGKNMKGACLIDADLCDVDLRETDLRQVNLSGADITGTKLYSSARDNWILDSIRCDYVYWDEAGEQRTPPDRNFRPGEFEELHKQLPTFEYIFEQGFTPLDPLIMDRVVQAVNERHKEFSLDLVNFDKRGQPHATFTVCHLEHVEKAKQQIAAGYEERRIAPDQQAQLMAAVLGLIENQNKLIDKIPSSRGLAMGDTYNIHGGQIGAIGQSASASGNTFQQITADLSRLHEEMQRSAKTPEQQAAAEDVAKAAQAARKEDEPAMLQHLKNAGKFALDCAKTVGTDVAAEYLKKVAGL